MRGQEGQGSVSRRRQPPQKTQGRGAGQDKLRPGLVRAMLCTEFRRVKLGTRGVDRSVPAWPSLTYKAKKFYCQ